MSECGKWFWPLTCLLDLPPFLCMKKYALSLWWDMGCNITGEKKGFALGHLSFWVCYLDPFKKLLRFLRIRFTRCFLRKLYQIVKPGNRARSVRADLSLDDSEPAEPMIKSQCKHALAAWSVVRFSSYAE